MKRPVALLALVLGCERDRVPAEGTLVVHLDTNAPLSTTTLSTDRSMALFDSVRVEVQTQDNETACPGNPSACQREFAASDESLRGLSFGIHTTDRKDLFIVVQMFPSALAGAEIDPRVTVAVRAPIVNVPDQGEANVSVFLDVESVGAGVKTAELTGYTGAASRVGSWPWAKRIPCVGVPAAGEVCIEGGAFWMGAASGALTTQEDRSARRVIGLSPYFLLDHEVKVAELRAFLGEQPALLGHVSQWTGSLSGSKDADWCTYTTELGAFDEHPVNCVTDQLARAYCQARGGDLPTEAQFEYVAGAFRGRPFVWGLDLPTCGHAVFGRATSLTRVSTILSDTSCASLSVDAHALIGGPSSYGAAPTRDFMIVGTARVAHLAGNLSEWTLDEYESREGNCWADPTQPNLAIDPVCKQEAESTRRLYEHSRAVRGGSWLEGRPALASNYRFELQMDIKVPGVGFRCARPGGGVP
jgi:formylglycine-generating enzyme required for sulfatase activity